jgi:molybdenum cofactor sulfurtransferase
VFVAGATAALKLVGETFPWTPSSSVCAYTTINHNSALGIRQQAAAAGATVTAVQPQQLQQSSPQTQSSDGSSQHQHQQQQRQRQRQEDQQQEQDVAQAGVLAQQEGPYSLFIAPAECNMSGTRYNCVELFQAWKQLQQRQQNQQSQQEPQGPQQQEQEQQQKQQQWLLLVDAAKACASYPPDCSSCSIDMLALSYYKIIGHPTGEHAAAAAPRG